MANVNSKKEGMVSGYQFLTDDGRSEILYAVTADGRVFQTGPAPVAREFDKRGSEWNRVYGFDKSKAVYIGHYFFPRIVRKWA